jgi:hypothetical protein
MIGGTIKKPGIALGIAMAGLSLGAAVTPASAADLGGDCCADLEERIAELEATTVRKGNRKVSLTISGFVNQQIEFWDDGEETNTYVGTNASDPTRFRFVGKAKITDDWSAGYIIELGVHTSRQTNFTADAPGGENAIQTRHSAWYLESKTLGKLTVGQTSVSNDGITELTLAKSITVAKPIEIFTPNSGFTIRGTGLTWGNLSSSSAPGEGGRYQVVRYDTPEIAGFIGSASWGQDDLWSVALRYAGEFGGFKLAGGIAYAEYAGLGDGSTGTSNIRWSDGPGEWGNELGLSVSVLHDATGLFATFAYGEAERYDGEEYENWNIQAGIIRKWFPLGKTTLYGEYYEGDFGESGGGAAVRVESSDVTVWGLAAIQSVDAAALDLYIAYRHYEADLGPLVAGGTVNAEDFQTVFTGAKIQF